MDNHNNHYFIKFNDYCKKMDIIVFCMFFHSFYILQPLDVKCFGPLKAVYGKEIEKMIRMHFMYIIKDNFFLAFKQVFFASMGEENVQAEFQAINFMLYNLKIMINSLDFKSKTLTPSNSYLINVAFMNLIIPKIVKDAVQNSIELKSKIVIHQNNFSNQLYDLVDV